MRIQILIFRFKGLSVDASKRENARKILFRKFSTKGFAFALIIRPLASDSDSRTLKLLSCFWKHLYSAPYGGVLV